jgi:hypothetical protein
LVSDTAGTQARAWTRESVDGSVGACMGIEESASAGVNAGMGMDVDAGVGVGVRVGTGISVSGWSTRCWQGGL